MAKQGAAYRSAGKRTFDLFASILGFLFLWPIFLLLALLVKLGSRGPILFRQERMGKSGRRFMIVKFRTMRVGAEKQGPGITIGNDSRITSVGRIMRTLKVDELPQLWNVLKGEMSLVGPRPELPIYLAGYSEEQKGVLEVRPGITDPASLAYCEEAELLAQQADPESYYREVILPHKLTLNLEYIRRMSFALDVAVMAKTCTAVLFKWRPLIYSTLADKGSSGASWQIKSSN